MKSPMNIINLDKQKEEALQAGIEALNQGQVLGVPTETVYGLICSPRFPEAVKRISSIKGRPDHKPFALFVQSIERAEREDVTINDNARKLAKAFWPGPLTLVLSAADSCPCAYQGSVGMRCPDYPFILEFLAQTGGLLVNTSLNRSGEPPVWELDREDAILEEIDLVIDGGRLQEQAPSTVVDCRQEPCKVLREGALGTAEIEKHTA